MKTRNELKNLALSSLDGSWGKAVLATVIFFLLCMVCGVPGPLFNSPAVSSSIFFPVLFLVLFPMIVGYCNAFKILAMGGSGGITENMFSIGFRRYWHNVGGMLLLYLYTLLWTLLLIVPGIIKGLSYSMTCFILVDEPELSPEQAICKSMRMMEGHKMELFLLGLSFIGWIFLSVITLGLGYFAVMPYMYATFAGFYLNLKEEYQE